MQKSHHNPRLVVISGPTGVGKTAVAVELAAAFDGEIVSADSMQVYRRMDIGTAKPAPAEVARIPHHLVDIADPHEEFDAARYAHAARRAAEDISSRGQLPFVVGGTGLYIRAFLYGLFEGAPRDPDVRRRLRTEADDHGPEILHRRLACLDPEAAGRIHPRDAFRIVRALEIMELTGTPLSEHHHAHGFRRSPFHPLRIALTLPREALYDRINRRVDAMIAAGLVEEVRQLLHAGYTPDCKPMQSIGYRHMAAYIRGLISWEEAVRTLKRDTRRYAKRQLTWLRADPDFIWMRPDEREEIARRIRNFLNGAPEPPPGCGDLRTGHL